MMVVFRYDFGYEWPWTYGHLIVAASCAGGVALAWYLRRRALAGVAAAVVVWALAGSAIVHGALRFNMPLELPTMAFLPGGTGRVLDVGAGSGRASLMVLLARPQAQVTALDIFDDRFGIGGNTPERLTANARTAGVDRRLDVRAADMRELPFGDASFDAAVSSFAIDHLNREGVARSLAELHRVVRPDGQMLLMVINQDGWVRTAFPFFMHHGYFGGRPRPERWRAALETAGFDVVEQGTQPATLYLLARRVP
jgi:SAM-dependent methyltransferase